jgi:3D (Asp-Asp-Asp) domain-containing protein
MRPYYRNSIREKWSFISHSIHFCDRPFERDMKRLILLFLLGPICAAHGYYRDNSLLARVTVYWAGGGSGADRYSRQHKSATGQRLKQGHCAVDPRRIPYGSKVVLPDGTTLHAVDTGTAVRNRKAARKSGRTINERNAIVIDKFFETKRQALVWANSNPAFVNVKVVSPDAPAVAKPNLTNAQPITLSPASRPSIAAPNPPAPQNLVAANGPSGTAIRNPLGRMGR